MAEFPRQGKTTKYLSHLLIGLDTASSAEVDLSVNPVLLSAILGGGFGT